MKTNCYLLAIATVLVTTCLMGADRRKVKTETVAKHRNDVEENWTRQYASYSRSKADDTPRESTRVKIQDKDQGAPSQGRKGEMLRRSYQFEPTVSIVPASRPLID